jgi:2-polyprenyl-6-methoxyphenol hydroxylase-like FAD-dependent oxidoreductase
MKIVISGGGVAGRTAMLALSQLGHSCHLFERSMSSTAGMGFVLVPSVWKLLQSLPQGTDVALPETRRGHPLHRFLMRSPRGNIDYTQTLEPGTFGMRRSDFLSVLIESTPSAQFDAGRAVQGYERSAAGEFACAVLDDGSKVEADLFVAADGIGSKARKLLFPQSPAQPARVLELVGLVRHKEVCRWVGNDLHKFQHSQGGAAIGVLPVSDEEAVWYLQFDAERFPAPRNEAADKWLFAKRMVGTWAHPLPELLAATDFERVHLWRPHEAPPPPALHERNLVLVGDAAQPLLPFTSQGVAAAIADVGALARELASMGVQARGASMARALQSYSEERCALRWPFVQKGRDLTHHFLFPGDRGHVLPITRDCAMIAK